MYFSRLLGKTIKEIPSDAETISHQLLVRAGMIQQVSAGIYAFMPLGWKVLKKIESIIRDEMDKVGGQELMMPSLQPIELWQQSGRLQSFGKTILTVTDRKDHVLALGPTHEEVITDIIRRFVKSYRDLPVLPYQIQNKFRDEPRPRGGLLRVREFIMKDMYSFDVDEQGLDNTYNRMVGAYKNVFSRCGLPALMVDADSGAIGGKASHEFMLIAKTGEDEIINCSECGYAANMEKAQSKKNKIDNNGELPFLVIDTPNIKTIDEVARFLNVPRSATLKAVLYSADTEIIIVIIRGDLEVNETKLKNTMKCNDIRLATDSEIKEAGLVAGSVSPIGIKGIKIVADDSIELGSNFVAGANKTDKHMRNINYPRDFKADIVVDIAKVSEGDRCPKCSNTLTSTRGIEVGHIFKLGTFLSDKLGAFYLDQKGISKPIVMGCYGIGVGRLLAAAVEQNHDDKGIVWPFPITPYQVYLCPLRFEEPLISAKALELYNGLVTEGIEVLFDDRDESPGVKFSDADLIGIPLRVTISPRTLQSNSVEIKWRKEKTTEIIPFDGVIDRILKMLTENTN